ncbi:hypothetical protein M427DRAFT_33385 [Gonapodya prolifera JEL478]|uniref:hAT-like transposase RNase-H fold domain-containing protein n=1 Tax=Gonapodya prolifera (strain JEL478) TaxID=1344416 RepID=A0A139AAU1_GONPJ|nr:hypothetical protein M427DRAFT_33385 [Gonapodya prolifera JEL478]|eukprot:KXS13942.1 hypothetical protein M427DRAFT_33385 [Gonapodya prolifera JEL478]
MAVDFSKVNTRVHCFAHILHLAVQAGLEKLQLPNVSDKDVVGGSDGPVKKDRVEVEKLFTLDMGLREWKLMDKDWNHLEKVQHLLEPLAQALSLVESAVYPTFVMVIPLFNIVMDKLEDMDIGLLLVFLMVWEAIMEVLQKYYAKTDSTRLYWIALVLHPAYKLSWMWEQGWETKYIDKVEVTIQATFDNKYASVAMGGLQPQRMQE